PAQPAAPLRRPRGPGLPGERASGDAEGARPARSRAPPPLRPLLRPRPRALRRPRRRRPPHPRRRPAPRPRLGRRHHLRHPRAPVHGAPARARAVARHAQPLHAPPQALRELQQPLPRPRRGLPPRTRRSAPPSRPERLPGPRPEMLALRQELRPRLQAPEGAFGRGVRGVEEGV
ncbi:hypothetical protein LTR60_003370, partial [Cryomyces antarcticus]